jgi:toxin FitB
MNLVDTSGWIEYFFAGPNSPFFAGAIERPRELLVPVVCLYEVFKKINLAADEARALLAIGQMKQGVVADLTEDIALKAALISLKHKLPMADSLIYATAQLHAAVVWTQDEHFRGLPGVKCPEARKNASLSSGIGPQ